jgi:hypothetical protein
MNPEKSPHPLWVLVEFLLLVAAAAMVLTALASCTPQPYTERSTAPSVYVTPEAEHVAAYAVDEMVPCRAFRKSSTTLADVSIRLSSDDGSVCGTGIHYSGESASAFQCRDRRWEVWISADAWGRWNLTQKYLAVAHELGHALGLADAPAIHVSYRGGVTIMAENALDHSSRLEQGLPIPWQTRVDREFVRASHCSGVL